jgi:iduronate 2-sulfatase
MDHERFLRFWSGTMRWTYWLVCIGGLLGGASPTLYADHYNVFLVAGQSNCDGRGPVRDLKGPLVRWAKPQQDVIISYSCSTLRGPQLTSGGFQPLQPGWSVAPGKNKPKMLPSSTFGPEVSFGRTMADHLQKEKIALIKFAEGGTSLAFHADGKVMHGPANCDLGPEEEKE